MLILSIAAVLAELPPPDYARPLTAEQLEIAIPIAPGVRAALAPKQADMPETPRTFTFMCSLSVRVGGGLENCLPIDAGEALPRGLAEHEHHATAKSLLNERTVDDRLRNIAKRRIEYLRFRPTKTQPSGWVTWPVIVRETISPGDGRTPDESKPLADPRTIKRQLDQGVAWQLGSYYPSYAVPSRLKVRLAVRCEVTPELRPFCWKARFEPDPEVANDPQALRFALASYQILVAQRVEPLTTDGKSAIGLQFEVPVNFEPPELE